VYVQAIAVLAVIAGQVAIPPEFKASEDVPVLVTASEKVTVINTVSPAFFEPLEEVVTDETVGAMLSLIVTVVPTEAAFKTVGSGSVIPSLAITGRNSNEEPDDPDLAVNTNVPRVGD